MSQHEACESYRLLISAAFDGELDQREQEELRRHVSACGDCRRWQASCGQLDGWLQELASADFTDSEWPLSSDRSELLRDPAPAPPHSAVPQSFAAHTLRLDWRLGLAAAVLLGIGVIAAVMARREQVRPKISVAPLAAMHAINVQSEQDQHAVLRTVEMDLRAMRLELKRLALDDAANQELGSRIDSLLTKTRQLQPTTPVNYQGD